MPVRLAAEGLTYALVDEHRAHRQALITGLCGALAAAGFDSLSLGNGASRSRPGASLAKES